MMITDFKYVSFSDGFGSRVLAPDGFENTGVECQYGM